MSKVGVWLGITPAHPESGDAGKVPPWHGVRSTVKFIWGAVWAAVAVAVFLLARARMPENDGFGGFIPLYFAVVVFIAGIAVTERSTMRVAKAPENRGRITKTWEE